MHTYTLDYITTGRRETVQATRQGLIVRLVRTEGWDAHRATPDGTAVFYRGSDVLHVRLV